jgi:hypothetical protein
MKRILFVAACMVATLAQSQLKLTYLDPTLKELKVKNFGVMSVDISTYRLCSSFVYKTLNQSGINILAGDFNLATGEEVYFSWTDAGNGFTTAMDDMGLYLPSGSFSTAANMVDFVEWGAGGLGRENVAVAASLWTAGEFLVGEGPWEYIGTGSASGLAQWDVLSSGTSAVIINELDCDQIGTDAAEFVELYGEPNASLDGLVVVFFNGSGDASYASFDLDGYALDDSGFFVLGNAGVNGAQIIFDGNTLQNGPDGVAIYVGDGSDWPNGTPVSASNLVDAIVYDTSDADDLELIALLSPSGLQLDEAGNGNSTIHSLSRIPDGGEPFDLAVFVAQSPTPGATNVSDCSLGDIVTELNQSEIIICSDEAAQTVDFIVTNFIGDSLIYVLTDENNLIISTSVDSYFDFSTSEIGNYYVWALAFNGDLESNALNAGNDVNDIVAIDCYSLSISSVFVAKIDCSIPICDGGEISVFTGENVIGICGDNNQDVYAFITDTSADLNTYIYVITDTTSAIVAMFSSGQFDFNVLNPGSYQVHGLSFIGSLDESTIEQGDSLSGIMALDGECVSTSFNAVWIHVFDCEAGQGCSDIYISQYLEGISGNNKALEIYNPTPFEIDLTAYTVRAFNNGSLTETAVLPLSGLLLANETFVITHPLADSDLLNLADITGGVANFNGDDAIVLYHNDEPIDVIGVIGETPLNGWPVDGGTTQNYTLIRKPSVNEPTTIWGLSATQWIVAQGNDYSNIGQHNAFFCTENAYVSFATSGQQVSEEVGQVQVVLNVSNVTNPFEITVDVVDQSMVYGEDYSASFPLTINVNDQNTTYVFEITIVDDEIEEGYEFLALGLTVNSSDVTIINDLHVISVEPSDQQYPLLSIAEVTMNDANGIPDSLDVFCELRGIVHGINFNSDGTHFHLIGGNAGIKVFDADDDLDYIVTEGDSVAVRGQIANFLGMTEFYPDTIIFLNAGNPLEIPQVINAMAEDFESRMVRIECVELIDASQWTNLGNGFDVDVTDGVNSFVMHVDLDTDIFGLDAPEGHFTLTGIGAQMDVSGLPYDSGYSIWPRYLNDISDIVEASFVEFPEVIYEMDQDITVDFINTSEGASTYLWDFGDGTTSTLQFPSHTYTYAFLSSISELTVSLTVDNGAGCIDSNAHTFNVVYNSVDELQARIVMYPNPVKDVLTVQSSLVIDGYRMMDAYGKLVQSVKIQSKQLNLNTQELAQGVYLIQMHTLQGDVVRRFIKE